jgi:putative protease
VGKQVGVSTVKKMELLSPAGDMERLKMAVAYGADAVYLAGTAFGMRSFAGNFTPEELPIAVKYAHDRGVKVHVTVNTMPRNDEICHLPSYLEQLQDAGVDALIVADMGAFTLAGKYAPKCARHISTQQSIANYECAQAWYDLGASRVVLARELNLGEIAEIRQKVSPELEIETFGHGAMCVSYSGRCLLSNYMTGRDSNRGACAQPCRYQYALVEEKRPGEYFPVFEDEKGTYILNSRDMCMIDHLDDLMAAGVDCIKIEGRAKSAYYAAIVTGAYRHCIDDVVAGRPLDPTWRDEVERVPHRIYSTGFYYGHPGQYTENSRYIRQWQICAIVESCDENGLALCSLRNKFAAGDALEAVGPNLRPFPITAGNMTDVDGAPLAEPRTPQMKFYLPLPKQVPPYTILRRSVDLSAK